jgi:hypothetical protein
MTRAKSTTKWTVLESIAPGDDLVELQISAEARSMGPPSLPQDVRGPSDQVST